MLQIPINCTGCYSCINICPTDCITMEQVGTGFFTPKINRSECINCDQCKKGCPVLHMPQMSTKTTAYAIKNRSEEIRIESTSGGMFSLLAKYVLERKGVVFGAAYNSDFSVQHIAVSDWEKISLLRGAKYAQSIIGTCLLEVKKELLSGRMVLFSGTPCQCAGLRAFLGKRYDNLITVDMICHGIPSPKVWQAYIDYRSKMENGGKRPFRINMRSKSSGWSHYRYTTEFDYGEGKISRIQSSQDLFMKAFIGNICLNSACSDCMMKGIERCTDFTLGDYWGIWNQYPKFDDNKGTSVVFVHTQKGRKILNQIQSQMDYLNVNIKETYQENRSLIDSSGMHADREEFLMCVTSNNFEVLINQYCSERQKKQLGVLRRVHKKVIKFFNRRYR